MKSELPIFIQKQNFEFIKASLTIMLCICQLFLFGQIQQSKGDIILATGEIRHGLISAYSDQDEPNILISDSLNAKSYFYLKDVTVINLLDGEKFVGKWYKTEKESFELLFQVLIESPKLSLYERNENGMAFFYVSKNDLLFRLENNKMIETSDPSKKIKQDYKYIKILGSLMADRMDLVSKLRDIRLEEKDLQTAISEYNNGVATYFYSTKSNQKRDPNWMIFTQYSHFRSYLNDQTNSKSFGFNAGIQYYFSKKSRGSFKFSVDYAKYHFLNNEDRNAISIATRWQYDIVRSEYYNLYMQLHLIDITSSTSKTSYNDLVTTEHHINPALRFSPAVGLEIKPFSKVVLLFEINNLFLLNLIGRSYSIGIKYDLGEKYW